MQSYKGCPIIQEGSDKQHISKTKVSSPTGRHVSMRIHPESNESEVAKLVNDSHLETPLMPEIEAMAERRRRRASKSVTGKILENRSLTLMYYKRRRDLWIAFRIMLILWAFEVPFVLINSGPHRSIITTVVSWLEIIVSIGAVFAAFNGKFKSHMVKVLIGWSFVSAVYHILCLAMEPKTDPFSHLMKHQLPLFILPLWGGVFSLPLTFLWLQQIAVMITMLVIELPTATIARWEYIFHVLFYTALGMLIIFSLEATNNTLSETAVLVQEAANRSSTALAEQVNIKEEQVKSERDMALFISHEVRNPLFNISNAIDFFDQCLVKLKILESLDDLPPILRNMRSYTLDLKVGVAHCTHLLSNVLNFSKLEQGEMKWNQKSVKLSEVCNTVSSLTRHMTQDGVDLKVDAPPDMWVHVDDQLLSQVLVNLVANALKFTSKGFVLLRIREVDPFDDDIVCRSKSRSGSRLTLPTSPSDIRDRLYSLGSGKGSSRRTSAAGMFNARRRTAFSPKQMFSTNNLQQRYASNKAGAASLQSASMAFSDGHFSTSQSPSTGKASGRTAGGRLSGVGGFFRGSRVSTPNSSFCKPHRYFVFEICDTGPGIRPEKQSALFKKFQQIGSHFGTGLGLMLSQKIVEIRGSKIMLESPEWVDQVANAKVKGSRFFFTLPLQEVSIPRSESMELDRERNAALVVKQLTAKRSVRPSPVLNLRVLLVDDSALNLKQLSHKLTRQAPFDKLHWTCKTTQLGQEALNLYRESEVSIAQEVGQQVESKPCSERSSMRPSFDIVVVDSQLGREHGMLSDGREIIRRIRKFEDKLLERGHSKRLPSIIISYSGHVSEEHRVSALEAGADLVWTKPLPPPNEMLQNIIHCSPWLGSDILGIGESKTEEEFPIAAEKTNETSYEGSAPTSIVSCNNTEENVMSL